MKVIFKCDWCAALFNDVGDCSKHERDEHWIKALDAAASQPSAGFFSKELATQAAETITRKRCRPVSADGCDGKGGYEIGCQWCMQYNPSDPGR